MSTAIATTEDKDKFKNLIGPTIPSQDRKVREMLVTARVGLLLKASFFGNLATRLKLVNAEDEQISINVKNSFSYGVEKRF